MAIYWPTLGFKGRTLKLCSSTYSDTSLCLKGASHKAALHNPSCWEGYLACTPLRADMNNLDSSLTVFVSSVLGEGKATGLTHYNQRLLVYRLSVSAIVGDIIVSKLTDNRAFCVECGKGRGAWDDSGISNCEGDQRSGQGTSHCSELAQAVIQRTLTESNRTGRVLLVGVQSWHRL